MEIDNPYTPPSSSVENAPHADSIEVPVDILKKIKSAWVAALFSAALTLIFILVSMTGTQVFGFDTWALIDVVLICSLALGIYKKSRTCAVLMFLYFIASKVVLIASGAPATSLPMAFVFIYFYWQGISGTFGYHALIKRMRPSVQNG